MKTYRIQFRTSEHHEVFIDAESEADAQRKFFAGESISEPIGFSDEEIVHIDEVWEDS